MLSSLRSPLVSCLLLSLLSHLPIACSDDGSGSAAPDQGDPADDAPVGDAVDEETDVPGGMGRVTGIVYSPNGEGLDVVAGAQVTLVGGPSASADAAGQFALDDVPAGESLTLVVAGPSDEDGAGGAIFGTHTRALTVPRDGTLAVYPYLLRGCRAFVDAAAGGTAAVDRCAQAGGVSVAFPSDAFVAADGEPFTGRVRIDMTAVDPEVPADRLGLPPPDEDDPAGGFDLGGAEIRLFDAAGGEPLALAAGVEATVRMEIAATPEGLSDEDVTIAYHDPDARAWVEVGGGTVEETDGRRYLAFTTDHFTTYRARACCLPPTLTCLLVRPEVCLSPGTCVTPQQCTAEEVLAGDLPCNELSITVEDYTHQTASERTWQAPAQNGSVDTRLCLELPADSYFRVTFRYADPVRRTSHSVWRNVRTRGERPAAACGPDTCADFCDPTDLGNGNACQVQLQARSFGCVTGTLETAQADPIVGPLDVLVGGEVVATVVLPEPDQCSAMTGFCAGVPVDLVNRQLGVELQDRIGHTFALDGLDSSSMGCECDWSGTGPCRFRDTGFQCAGSGSCQDVGTPDVTCLDRAEPLPRACVRAIFTRSLTEDTTACPGAGNYELELDATPSTGAVVNYYWTVVCEEGDCANGGVPVRQQAGPNPTLDEPLCLTLEGRYRVNLETEPSNRALIRLRGRAEQTFILPPPAAFPGPCTTQRTAFDPTIGDRACVFDWTASPATSICTEEILVQERELQTVTELKTGPCGFPCNTGAFRSNATTAVETWTDTEELLASTVYQYDGFGNLVSSARTTADQTFTTTYTYDIPARPTSIDVDTNGAVATWMVEYASPTSNLIAKITRGGSFLPLQTFTYDAMGRLTRTEAQNANGDALLIGTASYDTDGNLVAYTETNGDGELRSETTFTYDCF